MKDPVDRAEVEKLQKVVNTLRSELSKSSNDSRARFLLIFSTDNAQKQSASYAQQAQDLLERFSAEKQAEDERRRVASVQKEQNLRSERQELEEDRRKFSEAAVKLGKDKAALEVSLLSFCVSSQRAMLTLLYRLNASASWKRSVHGSSIVC